MKTNVLWALSSVGYSHLIRDIVIIDKLLATGNYVIDMLVPPPLNKSDLLKGYNLLQESHDLKSSGEVFKQSMKNKENIYDLMSFIQEDASFHEHDCELTNKVLSKKTYSLLFADEAFWVLTGINMGWIKKDFQFFYMSEFVGIVPQPDTPANRNFTRIKNMQFLFAMKNCDRFFYIGECEDVPDIPFGKSLPNQRLWAKDNCIYVKPIIDFNASKMLSKEILRQKLGLPLEKNIYLGMVSFVSDHFRNRLRTLLEECFAIISKEDPKAYFIIGDTSWKQDGSSKDGIEYHSYIDNLNEFFAASDCTVTQSGINKITALTAMKVPFVSISPDCHFEADYLIGLRLNRRNSGGKQFPISKLDPVKLYNEIQKVMEDKTTLPFPVGDGSEVANELNTNFLK